MIHKLPMNNEPMNQQKTFGSLSEWSENQLAHHTFFGVLVPTLKEGSSADFIQASKVPFHPGDEKPVTFSSPG